jgi:IS5 family transposase
MHLAYRWFTRLDLNAEIPDHSTFSKNRHGRFRQSRVFREVFEEIVRRCVEVGLVEGETLAVDGTMVAADASQHSRIRRDELKEVAQVSRTVQQYLAELEQAHPVADPALVSTTDPDALMATKGGGPARMAYYDNYLVDTSRRVILELEATPALFHQETAAARRMMERSEKLGLRPKSLAADKAYGSGAFLACG